MPTVPSFNQPATSAPGPAQNAFASANGATPDAFGAGIGQAQEKFGAAVERVGDQFEQRAQQFQAQANEASANEATTEYLIKQSEITENFKQLQGKDPKAAMAQYTTDLKNLRDGMRAGLANDEVRRQFDAASTRQFGYAVMNGASYASTQFRQYETGMRNAKVNAIVHATTGAEDQGIFEAGLKTIDEAVRQDNKGKSEEEISGMIRDKQGQAWRKRLADVADNDPEQARKIFTKNRPNIDGIVAQDVEKYINSQDVRVTSQRIANNVALGGATDTRDQKVDYMLGTLTPKWGKYGAAGIVSQTISESSFNQNALNKGDGSDGSDSIGIQQWNGPRAINLKAFAERNGLDWRDFKTQVKFIDHELTTTHRDVGEALKRATSPTEAADIATLRYEVPKGAETGDVTRVKGYDSRRSQAVELAGRTVLPVATLTPGNRGALEETARKTANTYADANGLDQRTREDLVASSLNKLDTAYGKQMSAVRDAAVGGKATLTQFVTNGPDGKNPVTDLDAVTGPQAPAEVRRAFLELPPADQKSVRDMVSRNAAANLTPTVATEETRARRQQLQGQMTLDPEAFLRVDPTKEKLTRQDISWLTSAQLRMVQQRDKTDEQAGNTDRAMRVLDRAGLLDVPGLRRDDRKRDATRWQQFNGGLGQLLDKYNLDHNGAQPSEDDIKKMAGDLLHEQVTSPGWFGTSVGQTKTPLYQQGPNLGNPPKMESIPQEEVNKIRDAYSARGVPNVTPQMVRRAYQLKLQRTPKAGDQANAE